MKSILFTNWSDQKFEWTWDSVPYEFEAGQTVYMQDYLANHFAKHLTDRELLKIGKMTNDPMRKELMARCIKDGSVSSNNEAKLQAQIIEQNTQVKEQVKKPFCDSCDSKGVRHKGNCPKAKQATSSVPPVKTDEDSFEGLK